MKIAAFIPARLQSERFPRKLLQDLAGKPVVLHTYENAVKSGLFDETAVITDSKEIAQVIRAAGGKVLMSRKPHPTGTDRIAEFAGGTDAEIIVNIQADEPFLNRKALQKLIDVFRADKDNKIDMASLMFRITDEKDFHDANQVKVVTDTRGFALYFSRAPIPFPRNGLFQGAWKHIGVYAFRREVLERIAALPQSALERVEKLENLRFLEAGFKIKMIETDQINIGIDTPEDLEKARKILHNE
jgi:3-deoxy-manno-octulosonate cytidylyltransferase (CMP-KDO synthetase)